MIASAEICATELPAGEFGFLLLSSLAGILVLTAAGDLVTLVVARWKR
ncbi:hypothetical protein [Fodinicola feengrottensis]|nr:hypothetical protein [Fodinicola feengrottensis]